MKGATLDELETVYRQRFHAFAAVAAGVTGDAHSGFDAVQDAFATAVRKRRRYRREAPLEAWLWRIVLNRARDVRRKRRFEPAPTEPPSTNGHEPDLDVGTLLAGLSERQRLAVFLRYYADLDYARIADLLDVAPGTVAATLNAAHRNLRNRLEEAQP